jgi:hypothetical protein
MFIWSPGGILYLEGHLLLGIGEVISKISLFANNMISYIKDPDNCTKKLLNIKKRFSKVAGYEINLQKTAACLYSNMDRLRKN